MRIFVTFRRGGVYLGEVKSSKAKSSKARCRIGVVW